jgi:hypothetical protein
MFDSLLNKMLPGGADGLMAQARSVLSAKPKPPEQMSLLQLELWELVRQMLSEFQVEEPIRSFILRLMESRSDEELRQFAAGLINGAVRVQMILDMCSGELS